MEFAAREMEHIIRSVTISSYQAQLAYWAQLPAGTSFDETTALPPSLQEGKKSYRGLWEAEQWGRRGWSNSLSSSEQSAGFFSFKIALAISTQTFLWLSSLLSIVLLSPSWEFHIITCPMFQVGTIRGWFNLKRETDKNHQVCHKITTDWECFMNILIDWNLFGFFWNNCGLLQHFVHS